ncbi:MAG: hypothetical protein QOJ00_2151, partial [Actinomycetota bacterium]
MCATFVRLNHVGDPPVEFHTTRQYTGALLAHSFYVNTHPGVAPAIKAAADANRPPILEPPIVELFNVGVSDLIGHESLVGARLLSIMAWLVGGLAVFGMGRRLGSSRAGVVAALLFELAPFAVVASRGFQPDPLGVGALAVALYSLVRYDEAPTMGWLAAAASAAAFTSFVKADLAPFLVVPFLALALARGVRTVISARAVAYVAACVAPALVWTLVAFSSTPGNYFIARFLTYGSYWRGVASQLNVNFGIALLVLAAVGVVTARGRAQRVLLGLLVAYAAFAVAFDYRVATHSYYSLPAFILVALAGGLAVDLVAAWVAAKEFSRAAIAALVALAGVGVAAVVVADARPPDIKGGVAEIARARAIGPRVCHDLHLLMVTPVYGVLEQYYGDVGGVAW